MTENILIKICGLSTPETLEAALDAGADMVGFVFFPKSPRHVSLEQAAALGELCAGRAQKVALVVNADDADIASIITSLKPDLLQLHGTETPERVADIKSRFGLPVMKAIGIGEKADLLKVKIFEQVTDRLLLDAKPPKDASLPGGNGVSFDWTLLDDFNSTKPWMLSGGLDPQNVSEAIRQTHAKGVDVSSGVESAPGVKDIARIKAFVANARLVD